VTSLWGAAIAATWLGVLVALSPCPLATNIAAVSYLGRHLENPWRTLYAGAAYAAGRALTYTLLGMALGLGLAAAPSLSFFLQTHMQKVLGPLLLLGGLVLLEVLPLPSFSLNFFGDLQERAAGRGWGGAFLLGGLLALSFCPVSAALFFGSLLPLTVRNNLGSALPALFGVGSALPAVAFALVLAFGGHRLSQIFSRVTAAEGYARRITGIMFVALGGYFSLQGWLGVFL